MTIKKINEYEYIENNNIYCFGLYRDGIYYCFNCCKKLEEVDKRGDIYNEQIIITPDMKFKTVCSPQCERQYYKRTCV